MSKISLTYPTLAQEAEILLEQECINMGIAEYRRALAEGGNGAVSAGSSMIKAAMTPALEAYNKWLKETRAGLASKSAGVFYFLDQHDPELVVWVALRTLIVMLHDRPGLSRVAMQIAAHLEAQANFDTIEEQQPALAAKMARKLKTMDENDGSKRALFVRRGGALADVKVVNWDNGSRLRTGTLLVQLIEESTGLITIETLASADRRRVEVRPTEACLRWLEHEHARCELLTPPNLPMVCRPKEWTNPFNGGYLLKEVRKPFVKTRNKGYLQSLKQHEMPWVYAAVNALQETAWAVNVPIYEVVKALWEGGDEVDALPRRKMAGPPPRPWAEGTEPAPEALHAWKVAAARAYEADAKAESKRIQLVRKLWIAEKMLAKGNRFHFAYTLDWRGRIYPSGAPLTPQGDDLAKGLLRFAAGCPLGGDGAYWLAIHGANTFGIDKVSFEERVQWVEEHEADILTAAADPLVFSWWMEADSPFCFLAFCMEWSRLQTWVDAGGAQEAFESTLPVAFDGSCNGLQNFSAMLRDPVGGAATGLVPNAKPADIYSEVARAAQTLIDQRAAGGDPVAQRWVGKMTRKLAKRNTMTVPYGVTKRGMRDQLYAELKESKPEHRGEDASFLAEMNFEAIGHVVVAARQAMDWLREAAKVAAGTGLPVRWTTPAGFLAVQDYREDVGVVADFTVLGRRWQLMLERTGDKLATRKQALGISPNFVHSLDAAHLMRTILFCADGGITDLAMIHDSYGCHAGNATRLRDYLREAFVEQYSQPVLEQFREELLAQLPEESRAELPPVPPMGTLDLEGVKASEYFFA